MNKNYKDKKLSDEERRVIWEKGTEAPFSGAYVHEKGKGMYVCKVCETPLFSSDAKFDSGTGWPSFSDVVKNGTVALTEDTSHGMVRTEVSCKTCGAHLGHVFDDGPTDGPAGTGKRYCINSVCLDLKKEASN